MFLLFGIGKYLAANNTKSGFLMTTACKSSMDAHIVIRAVYPTV
jgi:hypothetical protein